MTLDLFAEFHMGSSAKTYSTSTFRCSLAALFSSVPYSPLRLLSASLITYDTLSTALPASYSIPITILTSQLGAIVDKETLKPIFDCEQQFKMCVYGMIKYGCSCKDYTYMGPCALPTALQSPCNPLSANSTRHPHPNGPLTYCCSPHCCRNKIVEHVQADQNVRNITYLEAERILSVKSDRELTFTELEMKILHHACVNRRAQDSRSHFMIARKKDQETAAFASSPSDTAPDVSVRAGNVMPRLGGNGAGSAVPPSGGGNFAVSGRAAMNSGIKQGRQAENNTRGRGRGT